ncbi:hypothetical protein RB195_019458 [Necator americanus]|uniref:Uncharacterized protein n=1 Tax=Necator americanus TaxID=51031 RepID=A0ABR1CF69_NECAM
MGNINLVRVDGVCLHCWIRDQVNSISSSTTHAQIREVLEAHRSDCIPRSAGQNEGNAQRLLTKSDLIINFKGLKRQEELNKIVLLSCKKDSNDFRTDVMIAERKRITTGIYTR